ncbi:MAG: hypothetical protein GDA54_03690 [Alphaproteobacteria bacterium GM7ARS4]|nr:hypothetical protein [Alphaproteobacteria bacterium GM7ARS4]
MNHDVAHSHIKDDVTLRQAAAFTLASNWAHQQHKGVLASVHGESLYRYALPVDEETIAAYRNHFAHLHRPHMPRLWQEPDVKDRLHTLVKEAARMMTMREGKIWDDDEKQHNAIHTILLRIENDPAYGFDLDRPQQAWLSITLILAPFLQKGQMAFLWDKMVEKRGDADEALDKARFHLLKFLSIADSALAITPQQEEERLFSAQTEHGLALLVRLKESLDKITQDESSQATHAFPQGGYVMRQLILFLERTNALPSVMFARTRTHLEGERDGKPLLRQERIFVRERDAQTHDGMPLPPLKIQANTIRVQIQEPKTDKQWQGMLGIHTLSVLVCAFLLGKDVDRLVLSWYREHGDKNDWRQGKEAKSPTPERIGKRIDWHRERMEGATTLYQKIRMLADLMHESYREKHGVAMSTSDYRDLLYHMRHYRLHTLKAMARQDYGIETMNVPMTGKPWSFLLKKQDLDAQYDDIVAYRCRWLSDVKERCHRMDDKERMTLARALGVRDVSPKDVNARGKNRVALLPAGMPVDAVRDAFPEFRAGHPDDKHAKKRHFIDVMRDNKTLKQGGGIPTQPFGFTWDTDKANKDKADKDKTCAGGWRAMTKRRSQWAHASLLHMMARHLLQGDYAVETPHDKKGKATSHESNKKKQVALGEMPFASVKPSALGMTLEVEQGKKVLCSLTQGWRYYARLDKKTIKNLVTAYTKAGKGRTWTLPLLRASAGDKEESVEQAVTEMRRQRFIAAQAILQWEYDVLKGKDIDKDKRLDFPAILTYAGLHDDSIRKKLTHYRDYVFHDNVLEHPFRDAPDILRECYKKIEAEEKKRRQQKRRQHIHQRPVQHSGKGKGSKKHKKTR